MAVTEGGQLWTFGSGWNGRLGHGDEEYRLVPKLVDGLAGVRVCQASADDAHSMAVTEGGQVWTFGDGRHGQLGHGDKETQLVPKVVEGLAGVRVCQVSAGVFHSMAVTEGGQVWTFGHGEDGQLGHGDQEHQLVPKLVEGSLTCGQLGP